MQESLDFPVTLTASSTLIGDENALHMHEVCSTYLLISFINIQGRKLSGNICTDFAPVKIGKIPTSVLGYTWVLAIIHTHKNDSRYDETLFMV